MIFEKGPISFFLIQTHHISNGHVFVFSKNHDFFYAYIGINEEMMISEPGEMSLQFKEDTICIQVSNNALANAVVNSVIHAGGSLVLSEFLSPVLAPIGALQGAAWGLIHCGNPTDNESVAGPLPIEIMNGTIQKIWSRLESHEVPLHAGGTGTYWIAGENMFIKIDGIPTNLPTLVPIHLVDKMTDDDNVHIMLELATLGHAWGPAYVRSLAYPSHMDHIPLLYDALYTNPVEAATDKPRQDYRDLLTLAPCIGPWADPYDAQNVPSEWASSNRLFHPGDRNLGARVNGVIDVEYRGYFPGLDYMVMYNAYHLNWIDELPQYKRTASCACVSEISSESELTSELVVNAKFPSYKAMKIPIESYLAHNLSVSSITGKLTVKNDLIICRENPELQTVLTIEDAATLELFADNTITVREGNKIHITSGGILKAGINEIAGENKQATIILEKDAELIVDDASSVLCYLV